MKFQEQENNTNITVVPVTGMNVQDRKRACREIIESGSTGGDAFFLIDIGDVYRKHKKWQLMLPRIEPFYAIKCNSDPVILQALVSLNLGFDCASARELQTMLEMGVHPSRIIFANPCKPISHIHYAKKVGVKVMTFDNENELRKCADHYPEAELVLRVLADDSKAVCRLGLKYGAQPSCTQRLLELARQLNLNIVGVSFHVGSGSTDPSAFGDAVFRSRAVFNQAQALGFNPTLLDVGGGFPGTAFTPSVSFDDICFYLKKAIDECFPPESGVRIIGEPGRFYVASACCLTVNITAKRNAHETAVIDDSDTHSLKSLCLEQSSQIEEVALMNSQMAISTENNDSQNKVSPNDFENDHEREYLRERTLSLSLSPHVYCSEWLDNDSGVSSPGNKLPPCQLSSKEVANIAARALLEQQQQQTQSHLVGEFMYYVNDGVYGSFNCLLFDHAVVKAQVLLSSNDTEHVPQYPSSIWGPTCDSMDCIEKSTWLPELQVGDWLFYNDMGAYTSCAASNFNGFDKPHMLYTFSADCTFDVKTDLPKSFPVFPVTPETSRMSDNVTSHPGKSTSDANDTRDARSTHSMQSILVKPLTS